MLNDLEVYLNTSTTPELRDLILEAAEVLLTAGVDNHLFLMRNALDEADALGDFDVVNTSIVGTLIPLLHHHLREFGIKVVEETDLPTALSMFKAVLAIEEWADPQTLNAMALVDEDPETVLADILEVVGDLTSSDYLMVLESVSDNLITRIVEITDRPAEPEDVDHSAIDTAKARLKELFVRAPYGEDSHFIHALAEGLHLGRDFHTTIEPYLPELIDGPVVGLAQELVGFALASSLPREEIIPALDALKEHFNLNVVDLMQLDSQIRTLLGDH